jgi:hypothetical protein
MYSLLQKNTLLRLTQEDRSRKMLVASLMVLCVAVLGCSALVPAYIESGAPMPLELLLPHADSDILAAAESERGDKRASPSAQDRAKQILAFIEEQTNSAHIPETLSFIRNKAAERTDVQLARVSIAQKMFMVTGETKSRASLLAFVDMFRKEKIVAKAEVPVSMLTGRDGAFPFTLTITLRDNASVPVGDEDAKSNAKNDDKK